MKRKAVIIGAGFAADMHIQALKALGIQVAGVAAGHRDSAKRFAEKNQIPSYGVSVEEVMEDDVTDVHICTPPNSHAELIKKILNAGKNVICEKPLCITEKEAQDIRGFMDENLRHGKKTGRLVIDHNVRFFAAVKKIREVIKSGKYGKVVLVHGNYMQDFHALPSIYDWRYRSDMSGPMRAVTEIGSHWFDLAQFVTGSNITGVSATFKKAAEYRILNEGVMSSEDDNMEEDFGDKRIHIDSEDAASITLQFSNGAMGNVLLSEISHGRSNHLFLEVDMMDGSVWWNEEEPNKLYHGKKNDPIAVEISAFNGGFNESVIELFKEFYFGEDDSRILPDVDSGLQIVRICNAVYDSSRQHSAWVNVKQ